MASIIEKVSGTSNGFASTDPESFTLASAPQEEDLILITGRLSSPNSAASVLSPPTGFSAWAGNQNITSARSIYSYKIAGAAEGTSYQVTKLETAEFHGQIYVIRGVDTASPITQAYSVSTGITWTDPQTYNFAATDSGVAVAILALGVSVTTTDFTADAAWVRDKTQWRGVFWSAAALSAGSTDMVVNSAASTPTNRSMTIVAVNEAVASGPTLTSGTVTSQTTDGFTLGYSTDTANGTAYYVVYPTGSTAPSAAQIQAGTDGDDVAAVASGNQAVSATGADTFPAITGLNPGTTYAYSIVHYGVV